MTGAGDRVSRNKDPVMSRFEVLFRLAAVVACSWSIAGCLGRAGGSVRPRPVAPLLLRALPSGGRPTVVELRYGPSASGRGVIPVGALDDLLDIRWDARWNCCVTLTGWMGDPREYVVVSTYSPTGRLLATHTMENRWGPQSRLFRTGSEICCLAERVEGDSATRCLISLAGPTAQPRVSEAERATDYDLKVGGAAVPVMRQALVDVGLQLPPINSITRDGRALSLPNGEDMVRQGFPVIVGSVWWPAVAFSASGKTVAIADSRQLLVGRRKGEKWLRLDVEPPARSAMHIPGEATLRGYGVWADEHRVVFGLYGQAKTGGKFATAIIDPSRIRAGAVQTIPAVYAPPMPVVP